MDTTVPIQPSFHGSVPALTGPSLYIAGQTDNIVPSWYVRSRYNQATHVPAVFGELRGANHFLPGATKTRLLGVATAWFRFWLMGDEQARDIFFGSSCGMCADFAWSAVARNALIPRS